MEKASNRDQELTAEISELLFRCDLLAVEIDMLKRHPHAFGPEADEPLYPPIDWLIAE